MDRPRIAVLALQGDFQKHIDRLTALGADAFGARLAEDLLSADGIVLPGGESTTMGKLLVRFSLLGPLQAAISSGKAVYGTCAGMILLAKRISDGTGERGGQQTLEILDITVSRNAYGRQIDSFEAELEAPTLVNPTDAPLKAVFIRAPVVEQAGPEVEILARYGEQIVFVRQGAVLASSFHPELTDDYRVHQYFLNMVQEQLDLSASSASV